MTVSQAIVTVALLAQVYGVDPALLQCIVHAESDYNVNAVNGPCVGLAQWHPDTRVWLGELAQHDEGWLHGDIGAGDVLDLALTAWAIKNGYGSHWATFQMCGG